MSDTVAQAIFLAGLPTGDKGQLIPGHTTWADLGPKAKERYRDMAQAAVEAIRSIGHLCTDDPCINRDHYELRA